MTLPVLVDPPVVDQPDRHHVQEVQLLAARPPGDDEAGVLEDAQVLHDAEARHLELRLELGQRAPVAHEELVEQEAASWVCECLEDEVLVRHCLRISD